ncbi:AMP-binding protein [Conexibacter sp. JD483]|uniref:AMP-binding protein n=1 Tax=unclassified Conexibacter TaxID=2627773 RepID=UPI002723FF57|nr:MULTISPECIES: AMP-binding protein [unclassified Conexibacter]MDO8184974.1 AMP-binding protein [Conexibacter sp. CPCC 205706]MDO8198118.1 AMP-binding protein [Conexibacter sp. CPCC 205762]MDR9368260.1 AMP-binding protein [Conexibacter sp. JD483]
MNVPSLRAVGDLGRGARALAAAGIVTPRVGELVQRVKALRAWGHVPIAGFVAAARSRPHQPFLHDDEGTLTYAEADRRSDAIAHGLRASGLREGDAVGLLCRNGRAFVEGMLGCSKAGLTMLFLNTDFAGPQLLGTLEREGGKALIADAEFDALLPADALPGRRFVGHGARDDDPLALERLAQRPGGGPLAPPAQPGKLVILTSGTTGTPKGAARSGAPISAVAGILDRIPLKAGQTHLIAAPLFHGWGLLHLTLALALPATVVLQRRFEPEELLRVAAARRVDSIVLVPTMLQRIMQLPPETRARHDLSSLSALPLSGSAIPGDLATRAMDAFGDVVLNFYGSTETGWATIATPADLRAAPGTAGRPPMGTDLLLLDEHDRPLPQGATGRIFVASRLRMEGYTDRALRKAEVDGRMSTGDVGHLDASGRLFVDGRDDEMIVSGGENVFPREVEDLLVAHDAVLEAAVIGVDDEQFGQRLRAFVVLAEGAQVDGEALQAHVRANLARYKVPREVVVLAELPRNPTGKVLKRQLAAWTDPA